MAVPNSMADLATLAGSNSPAGSEAIGNSLDNYLRAHAAIIRSTNATASATIAAASTTDIGAADGESVQVTGSATITSLGTGFTGCRRELRFSGACTLTNSGNLALPGAVNMTTTAGDVVSFRCVGAGQWVCTGRAKPAITSGDVVSGLGYTPVNKAGDTMTGTLSMTPSGNDFLSSARSGYQYNWYNDGAGTLGIYDLTAASPAWTYSTESGGLHTMRGGVNASNEIRSDGTNSSFNFQNRSGSDRYVWYATSGIARLYSTAGGGDTVTVASNGDLTATSIVLGGSKKLSQITVSNAAPGVLPDGALHLRY